MFYTILLIFSIILNIILLYWFYVSFYKIIPKYEKKLLDVYKKYVEGYEHLRKIDLSGAFENDDYVGDTYKLIKETYQDLEIFLSEPLEKK